ncbi:uncharacterized protein ATC70_012211 [Mucor velutinosus]|uniref:Uncharacterized protein n=1 Tax=Mucor velutinosus TaxID=708070 RepID=A0AAN7D534_9FUNG|nr:hypothetical protein ATC70_012211 [Mucor velutinosus]
MTSINPSLGPAWTYRILGLICLACNIVACLTVKARTPINIKNHKKLSHIINFSVLKNTDFGIFLIASNIGLFGYFIPYFFLPSYATFLGLSDGFTSGSFFALFSPITACLLGMEQFPLGLSLLLFSNIVLVFGPNIASAIEAGVGTMPFFSYKIFAGVSYLAAAIILVLLKLKIYRNLFARVQ